MTTEKLPDLLKNYNANVEFVSNHESYVTFRVLPLHTLLVWHANGTIEMFKHSTATWKQIAKDVWDLSEFFAGPRLWNEITDWLREVNIYPEIHPDTIHTHTELMDLGERYLTHTEIALSWVKERLEEADSDMVKEIYDICFYDVERCLKTLTQVYHNKSQFNAEKWDKFFVKLTATETGIQKASVRHPYL